MMKVAKKDLKLKKLIDANNKYMAAWVENGGRLTFYKCGHCKKKIQTPQPEPKNCSGKGFWDSAKVCMECGNMNFVAVYPSGETKVYKMD